MVPSSAEWYRDVTIIDQKLRASVGYEASLFIFLNIFVFGASMMAFISNSMTDDDTSLPLDLNKT